MKYFITGATGYIGTQLSKQLVAQGHEVNALFRSESKTLDLKQVDGVTLHKGDIMDQPAWKKPRPVVMRFFT